MPMTVLIDSLEKNPLPFKCRTERKRFSKPDTGDYSIKGLENRLRIERKTVPELWRCLGIGKEAYRDQLRRLEQFPYRMLLIEGSLDDMAQRPEYSRLSTRNAIFRMMRWSAEFAVPIWFMGPRSKFSVMAVEQFLAGMYDGYRRDHKFPERWRTLNGRTNNDESNSRSPTKNRKNKV